MGLLPFDRDHIPRIILTFLRARARRSGLKFGARSFRHPSKVNFVGTMDSVHDREDRKRQSPAQVRTDRLHHGRDSRADHVVRE